ncbi:DPP IV N-terminal domain-containing protein [Sphingomonas sp. IC4-52]|uniref:S9 family peptidase n=1 Tax=Sphingomonas sp. IC4-52 TaxID=2887202 RepID=UPI0039F10C69
MRIWMAAIGAGLTIWAGAAMAKSPMPPEKLTLQRVFASPDLAGGQPQALRLSPDGTLLTSVRPRADERNRFDLWAMDTRTGQSRMLVDSRKVGSGAELSEAEKMQRERDRSKTGKTGILDYDWAPDGKSILVPVDGELFVATLDGNVQRLDGTRGALNPVVSPRGTYVSFVRDQNLWVQPAAGGGARQLTTEGSGTVHFGEAEFVAQEEMHRRTGYWWSPNDRLLAVERFDEAPVRVFTRASIGATGTSIYQQRYPAAGAPNVLVDLFIMKPDGTGKVKVDLGPERDIYLARVDWLPDGSALLVQRQSRDQRTLDMLRVDPATGKSTVLFSERAGEKSWVNLSDAYRLLSDGSLIWRSERDGFGHLYRWKAGNWTQLTKGQWVVDSLVAVDEANGRVVFTANKDGVLERHLYALNLARPQQITRLTETGWSLGGVAADGAGTRFIISRSNPSQPRQTYIADANGKRIAWVNENAVAGDHPYAPFLATHRPTEFGTIKAADGTPLHWQMIKPVLQKGKRYPVFFMHYGGPGSQDVWRDWPGNMPLRQFLVQQGWIVFQIDNRGSDNRGKAFEDAIWHAMGTVEVDDQLAGAGYLKSLPFVDPDKIAIYGWSYGGYLTLKMMEAHPGVFAAGISGAPVTDWALYDTHYTERYMGDPTRDAEAYRGSSALEQAARISDPLMLMHGMADDNVFLDNATAFAARMQSANKPFEMMLYPGKAHGAVREIHPWTTMLNFLDRHVTKNGVK